MRVRSHLIEALMRLLYLRHSVDQTVAAAWQSEILAALCSARHRFVPSMAQRIDLGEIWSDAWDIALPVLKEMFRPSIETAGACPFTLNDLLVEKPHLFVLEHIRG